MNAAVGLTAGLGLDGDRCIRVIPRQLVIMINTRTFSLQPEPPIFTFVFDRNHVNLDLTMHQENQKQIWPSSPNQ